MMVWLVYAQVFVVISPCLIPAKAFYVHEDSHQLRNGYGRVSIVQLEGNLLIQLCDIIVMFLYLQLLSVRLQK